MHVRPPRDVARAADGPAGSVPTEGDVTASRAEVLALERRPSEDSGVELERALLVA
jgi:hypothetical protein